MMRAWTDARDGTEWLVIHRELRLDGFGRFRSDILVFAGRPGAWATELGASVPLADLSDHVLREHLDRARSNPWRNPSRSASGSVRRRDGRG